MRDSVDKLFDDLDEQLRNVKSLKQDTISSIIERAEALISCDILSVKGLIELNTKLSSLNAVLEHLQYDIDKVQSDLNNLIQKKTPKNNI